MSLLLLLALAAEPQITWWRCTEPMHPQSVCAQITRPTPPIPVVEIILERAKESAKCVVIGYGLVIRLEVDGEDLSAKCWYGD